MSDELVSAPAPSSGDRVEWKDQLGKLLVVEPASLEVGVQTVHGLSDAVRAEVHVITGPGTADDYADVLIFPKVLQSQLKGQIGAKVVGRLGQGEKKQGQDPPWVLLAATDDDLAKAREWLAARVVPVASVAAVSNDPWAAPATAQAQPPF